MTDDEKTSYYVNEIFEVVDICGRWKYVVREVDEGAVSIQYSDWSDSQNNWLPEQRGSIIHGTEFVREIAARMIQLCDSIDGLEDEPDAAEEADVDDPRNALQYLEKVSAGWHPNSKWKLWYLNTCLANDGLSKNSRSQLRREMAKIEQSIQDEED